MIQVYFQIMQSEYPIQANEDHSSGTNIKAMKVMSKLGIFGSFWHIDQTSYEFISQNE